MGVMDLALVKLLAAIRQVIRFEWSDSPLGFVFDPIPNPRRYLNITVSLAGWHFTVSLDLGNGQTGQVTTK